MRLDEVKKSGLIDKWKKTIVDDGPIDGAMRKLNVKTVFISDLITINHEECDLAFTLKYNARMLTWSRIFEWGFVATFLHMLFTVSLILMTLGMAGSGLWTGETTPALKLVGGVLFIQAALFAAYLVTESAIRSIGPEFGSQLTPLSFGRALKILSLIPVALVIYCLAAIHASFAKRIKWRDATYEIRNRFDIRVIDDKPFSTGALPADQTTSL